LIIDMFLRSRLYLHISFVHIDTRLNYKCAYGLTFSDVHLYVDKKMCPENMKYRQSLEFLSFMPNVIGVK